MPEDTQKSRSFIFNILAITAENITNKYSKATITPIRDPH